MITDANAEVKQDLRFDFDFSLKDPPEDEKFLFPQYKEYNPDVFFFFENNKIFYNRLKNFTTKAG
jgi:hypothetical protein